MISHIADEEDDVIVEAIFKTLKEQWIMCYIGKDFINAMPAVQKENNGPHLLMKLLK